MTESRYRSGKQNLPAQNLPRQQTSGKKLYSELADDEKWKWHADDYAFRIVILGEAWGLTSPCDPHHQWFDRNLIQQAVERKQREQHARQDWNRKELIEAAQRDRWRRAAEKRGVILVPPGDLQRHGRQINERYARAHGFANWDACWDAWQKEPMDADGYKPLHERVLSWLRVVNKPPCRGPAEPPGQITQVAPIPHEESNYLRGTLGLPPIGEAAE